MKKLFLLILFFALVVVIGFVYFVSPKVYSLSCSVPIYDLNVEVNDSKFGDAIDYNFIYISEECQSNEDCKGVLWKYDCGVENSCSNEVIECINNKCEKVVYFDLFASCV